VSKFSLFPSQHRDEPLNSTKHAAEHFANTGKISGKCFPSLCSFPPPELPSQGLFTHPIYAHSSVATHNTLTQRFKLSVRRYSTNYGCKISCLWRH